VHRLVQAVARARSETNGSVQGVVARLIARLAAIYPDNYGDPQSWPLYAQLTPHLLARRDTCLGDDAPVFAASELLNNAGGYLYMRGAYSKAATLIRDALAIKEKALGPEHPDMAISLNNLAFMFNAQGDYARARPLFERALAIHEKALGPEHPETANILH